MTCHDVQLQLSLYLYGELEFATEEAVEQHLANCAFCQQALAREKTWHTVATSEHRDVPLDLLSRCRQDLRNAIKTDAGKAPVRRWRDFLSGFRITPTRWSYQLAAASFLVFIGFTGGRVIDGHGWSEALNVNRAGLLNPSTAHIRDIQPNGPGQVRIVVDQVDQREVTGSLDDQNVRRWLLVAIQDPGDPGIRVDSVEMLSRQNGADVRDALLNRIQHDPNAAVRLKALDSIRRFSEDRATQIVLRSVLEHDADPTIRSEAIDVLAPANERLQLSPELAVTLQSLARSDRDDYVRGRCLQLLRSINAPVDVY
ncbi:MAG: HEAT repeat domain-containing protein [Acidobacteriaceae bacterium]|nr:HEAT repeat domain-containing protein [Acidobacteriaceae bacterium]